MPSDGGPKEPTYGFLYPDVTRIRRAVQRSEGLDLSPVDISREAAGEQVIRAKLLVRDSTDTRLYDWQQARYTDTGDEVIDSGLSSTADKVPAVNADEDADLTDQIVFMVRGVIHRAGDAGAVPPVPETFTPCWMILGGETPGMYEFQVEQTTSQFVDGHDDLRLGPMP